MKLCKGPIEIMAKEISGLKREVKRAKLFEIQRHVRRIRQLANKKGTEAQLKKNQRKVERFEKELEFLKDAEVTEIVQRITSKEGDEDGHRVDQEIEVSDDNIDLKNRALDRIIQSTKLQKFLEKVSAGEDDSAQTDNRSSNTDAAPKNKQRKKTKQKSRATNSFTSGKPQPKEEDEDNTDSDAEVPKQQKATKQKAAMNKSLASGIDPGLEEFKDDNVYFPSSDFSESDVGGEDSDDICSLEHKPKGLESCFVQTMSGRKKDTLSAKSKQGKERGKAVNDKGKKNRKGQRARQQMWEKVHGKSAKHLHKKKMELSSKEGKEARKQKNVKTQHSLERKGEEERLHPSWEATKRKRLQETQKVEFKGQKIRFDDSE